jgi:hypothetical protein
MNSVTQHHINNVIDWVHGQENCQPSITKDRFVSLVVMVEEFKRLRAENEGLKAVFVQAITTAKTLPDGTTRGTQPLRTLAGQASGQ